MSKEQTLLVVSLVVGGLVVWGATGKYASVDAATLSDGKSVPVVKTVQPDLVAGLSRDALKGRTLTVQIRPEKRPPLPEIPTPQPMPLLWVRPVPSPAIAPDHWRPLRQFLTPFAVEKVDTGATNPGSDQETAANVPEFNPLAPKKRDMTKVAKLVKHGEELPVEVELTGAMKGKPDWVILEQWPNVGFNAHWLGSNGKQMAEGPLTPEDLAGYDALHLKKTLDNEFHEQRIGGHLRQNDRVELVQFAKWVWNTLPSHSAEDNVPYGLEARRKAIEVLETAKTLGEDAEIVKQLGAWYRATWDIERELKTYTHYLASHPNDTSVLYLVGDAYERLGAFGTAREGYERAAQTGDVEAKLRAALAAEHEGDLDGAIASLKALSGISGVGQRATTALARIRLAQGSIDEAAALVAQAQREPATPALSLVAGAVQYAQGKFPEAAASFLAGQTPSDSTGRSDRGMALSAAAHGAKDLDPAAAEFQACIDVDPTNLFDPFYGLGDVAQRRGETSKCHDLFDAALARDPNSPWMLLRLGTLNLQENQAAKALEKGLKLLEVAPGCTEGLWLVGRAAAALDKPDFEKAESHLRRALEKERENTYFLNEYARVLLAAGRFDEAIKQLEAATEVNKGVGRNDPRLLALLGYVRFVRGKPILEVQEVLTRARLAQPDEVRKEWIATAQRIITEWDKTRIWEDDFSRTPSSVVGNGWKEIDAQGPQIAIDASGHCLFAGVVKTTSSSREATTRLEREEELPRFKETWTSFKAQQGAETIFHIYYGTLPERTGTKRVQGWELGLGCDRNGSMVVWGPTGGKTGQIAEQIVKDAQGQPRQWPLNDFHIVRIVRIDDAKGLFELWLDDEKIGTDKGTTFEIPQMAGVAGSGRNLALGFLVDADGGMKVDVAVEFVNVKKVNR